MVALETLVQEILGILAEKAIKLEDVGVFDKCAYCLLFLASGYVSSYRGVIHLILANWRITLNLGGFSQDFATFSLYGAKKASTRKLLSFPKIIQM